MADVLPYLLGSRLASSPRSRFGPSHEVYAPRNGLRITRELAWDCANLRVMAHEVIDTPRLQAALERIRPVIAALPGAFERLSHGSPTFFVGDGRRARTFASLHDERKWGEGRLCLWLAAPDGMQAGVVAGDPRHWFALRRSPGVGSACDWTCPTPTGDEAAGALEDAHAFMSERTR